MKLISTLFCLTLSALAFGQKDTIFTVSSESIICSVKHIGDKSIQYQRPEIREDLDFKISLNKVSKVVFENGKVLIPNRGNAKNKNLSLERQKGSAIKLNFATPVFATLEVSYEKNLDLGKSIEFVFAYKGTNMLEEVYSGYNFRLGYKFLKDPHTYIGEDKYAHILKGTYIKPEISYSYLSGMVDMEGKDRMSDTPSVRDDEVSSSAGAIMINFGNQFVYSNSLLVDVYMGIGYGFTSDKAYDKRGNDLSYSFRGGYGMFVDFPHLAFSAGIRIGILL
ncbi:hypothetical protein [Luteibaculum oceani]|uniref:Outer membrane protein beta-barrel domain-containing protein n=1 Tax=Luteibaculum oceani TaxID=1294296 RepID=A0A5C6UZP7_9FLAO|nr:hypothetical protein [Luteibaculum oceani]TXC76125.1 hypothetical protein FRX97_11475 [Luteibaculum oceani]